jgi:uncharacterized membrane protein YbhN (UPF0104 family)
LAGDISRRTSWRKTLYSVGITFGVGLLAYQSWRAFLAMRQYTFCGWRPTYLSVAVVCYLAAYFVQMVAWALIMRSLHAPLSADTVARGYAISFLPRYIPGTVWGYLSRSEWLMQAHNIPYSVSTMGSVLEAAMFLTSAVALGALYWVSDSWKLAVAAAGLFTLAMVWLLLPWAASRFGGERFHVAPANRQSYWLVLPAIVLYLLFWLIQGGALLAVGGLVCVNSTITLPAGIASAALSWALGFIILFVPAGLGIREWSLSALLAASSGVDSGQAAMIGVVSRVLVIASEIIVLVIALQRQLQSHLGRGQEMGDS